MYTNEEILIIQHSLFLFGIGISEQYTSGLKSSSCLPFIEKTTQDLKKLQIKNNAPQNTVMFCTINMEGTIQNECLVTEKTFTRNCTSSHTISFQDWIHKDAKPAWQKLRKTLLKNKKHFHVCNLSLSNKLNQKVPCLCIFIRLTYKGYLSIILYNTPLANIKSLKKNEYEIPQNNAYRLYHYIQKHFHEPLPSLHKLALMLGTNECTLKKQFKQQYQTSIYQFYIHTRLYNAKQLIEHTNMSFQEIALCSGFNSYNSFHIAYKKHFGNAIKFEQNPKR